MNYGKKEFERLFKDNYPHMYRLAFSMVENADDAVQHVYAQIWLPTAPNYSATATDTALVIRMREATKLREVKVLTKEEINEIQRLP